MNEGIQNVLVTGITGFLGSHVALQLLNRGYAVKGTMRDLRRKASILEVLKRNSADIKNLSFAEAHLTNRIDWARAMEGIDYVMHIASPLPFDLVKDENDLIIPAREGTLNVLEAAQTHHVKRVVVTSSIAAIGYGHKIKDRIFTEDDWTDITDEKDCSPYIKSKTIAEKAAWEFVNQENIDLEIAVINPGYILGPLLEKDYSDSAEVVKKILEGKFPGLPRLSLPLVDVRDTASLHIMAMEHPQAAGHRFICVNESYWIAEIAKILRNSLPDFSHKIKTRVLPDILVRFFSLFDREVRTIINNLGHYYQYDNTKAREMLGWRPRSNEEAILTMADALIKFDLVK